MSTNRTDFIVFGYIMPYEIKNKNGKIDLDDEKFLPLIEGHKDEEFSIITDGMCREYTVFGKVIERNEEDSEGWAFLDLSFQNFFEPEKVKEKYRQLFELEPLEEPKLFIFSHLS